MKADHEIERAWQLWESLVDLENFLLDLYYEDFIAPEKQNQPGTNKILLNAITNIGFKVSGETKPANPGEEPGKG